MQANSPGNRSIIFWGQGDGAERFSQILDDLKDRLRWQPTFIFQGRGNDVAVGLAVEALGGDTEVIGVLVNELTFLAIHAGERVRTAFLFGLKNGKRWW